MTIHVFGLTGGLASGKSSVAKLIAAAGVPVIDADLLAREVVAKGSEGLAEVVKAFGDAVLLPDGTMDRAKVAEIVFADPDKRRRLNGIVHPRIAMLSAQRVADLEAAGAKLACYEAALLVENGLADAFRPLVVVALPQEIQVARARTRDASTEDQARARIVAQLPLEKKVAAADFVIDNGGDLESTARQVTEVLAAIRRKLDLA